MKGMDSRFFAFRCRGAGDLMACMCLRGAQWRIRKSRYGIERSVTPSSKIFGRDEGLRAPGEAEEILELCRKLIREGKK